MEENLDNPPTRRAAERRTRSNRAKVPRGSPASREHQQSIRLVTNAWTRVSRIIPVSQPVSLSSCQPSTWARHFLSSRPLFKQYSFQLSSFYLGKNSSINRTS